MKLLGTIEGKNGIINYFTYDPYEEELRLNRNEYPLKKYGVIDYITLNVYQDYYDFECYRIYKTTTYLDHFLKQLEKSKAKLNVVGFDFTEEEMNIGFEYIKNYYPVSYEYIKDQITPDNFEYMIECEYGNNFKGALEVGNGYLEGYTGIYGNNDLFELLDYFIEVEIQELFYENEEFTTEYVKACLESDYHYPEYECLHFDYEITDYINKEKYRKLKEYYRTKNKINRELRWISQTQQELLDIKHGKSLYSDEFTQELFHKNLRSIRKAQENIREYKKDLERLMKEA